MIMTKFGRTMMDTQTDAFYNKRAFILKTLLAKYSKSTYPNASFYKCADEWIARNESYPGGLYGFYKDYYAKEDYQIGKGST